MRRDWSGLTHNAWKLAIPLCLVIAMLTVFGIPQRLNLWIYDTLVTGERLAPADQLELIAIDEKSLRDLGRWPWPRRYHAELVNRLTEAGAKTIVFDLLLSEKSQDDQQLANAMRRHGNVILPVHMFPSSADKTLTEQLPVPELTRAASALGHVHAELGSDGVARGLYLYSGLGEAHWPAISLAAAQASDLSTITQPFANTADTSPYVNVRSRFAYIPFAGRSGSIPTSSYIDVIRSGESLARFRNKVVFIGATAPGFGDVLPTPLSGLSSPMSGVEFHANAFSAIAQGKTIATVPDYQSLILTLALIVVISLTLPRLKPGQTLWVCLMTSALLLLGTLPLFRFASLWLPVAQAFLVPVIAYPLWSTRRLSLLNRFLNRQLDTLGRDPGLGLREPRKQQPQRILAELRDLLQAEGWWLSQNGIVIERHNLTDLDKPPELASGNWSHVDGQSWIRIHRGDREFVMGLSLPQTLSREASRRYLQRLPLEKTDASTLLNRGDASENIGARIERVRGAIELITDMREFISHGFERMPDGIIVTDSLASIQLVNAHIESWFGEPRPSLIGMSLTRLLNAYDPRGDSAPWQETIADTLTLSQTRTLDLHVRGRDLLIHLAPFSMSDTDQHGIIANISNISDLREQQRQHREAIDFISHDVRSPLVSQLALIEQLKRSPEEVGTDQLEQLARLAKRSYRLAEEFVQLARAEQLTETRFYDCEFLSVVENARDSVSEQAASKGIELALHGSDDLWLRGNAELLERAVINLLTNAVQYSSANSTVLIQAFQAGHQACLTVADEGSGIADDELPELFTRYQRQKSSELSGNWGTGLGLSFVKVVVDKHQGEIEVASVEGEGSVFTVRLPLTSPLAGAGPDSD